MHWVARMKKEYGWIFGFVPAEVVETGEGDMGGGGLGGRLLEEEEEKEKKRKKKAERVEVFADLS